jgi:hypothetical protein
MHQRGIWVWVGAILGVLLCQDGGGAEPGKEGVSGIQDLRVTEWLETMERKFASAYEARVVVPFRKQMEKVRQEYQESLKAGLADLVARGNQQEAVIFKEELQRLEQQPGFLIGTDSNQSSLYLRTLRQQFLLGLGESEKERDAAVRQVHGEFDAALVEGGRQLAVRQMGSEAALVRQRRLDMARVWLPRMRDLFPDVHPKRGKVAQGKVSRQGTDPVLERVRWTRKEVEAAVQWVLEAHGMVSIRQGGKTVVLRDVGELPSGRVDFVQVSLDGNALGRPLVPGELLKLAALSGVEQLTFTHLQASDADLGFLKDWRHLELVSWEKSKVSPLLAEYLSGNPQLAYLRFPASQGITAEFLGKLALGVLGLRFLDLNWCPLDDTVWDGIQKHQKLDTLFMNVQGLTSAGISRLASLRGLRELRLRASLWEGSGSKGLDAFARLKLESFGNLNTDSKDFESQVKAIKDKMPQLKGVVLEGQNMTVEQAETLRRNMPNLSRLTMNETLPAPGVGAVLAKMPKLESLCSRNPKLGDDQVGEFLGMRNLRVLDLQYTQVSDASSAAMIKSAEAGLKVLKMAGSKFTPKALEELKHRLPNFKVLLEFSVAE